MNERGDFVTIRLSAKGARLGALAVLGGTYEYHFEPGVGYELTRAEAAARLRDELDAGLLEEVPASQEEKT